MKKISSYEYAEHLTMARKQHPEESLKELHARVMHRYKHLNKKKISYKKCLLLIGLLLILSLLVFTTPAHAQYNIGIAKVGGQIVDSSGLPIKCLSGCGGAASFKDKDPFTFGTSSINNIGGVFDDTPPAVLTTGLAGVVRLTPNRALHFNLRNQAGTEIGTSSNPLQVTGANGTFPMSGSVSVSNFPATQAVTGTFFQTTQPVSIAAGSIANAFLLDATFTGRINTLGQKTMANSTPVVISSDQSSFVIDVNDRAARLLGVVYGSQGQQLKQTPTNFNLQMELATGATLYDARQIRALTATDVVTDSPPTLTKGTQGATGFSVQNIHDAGRTRVIFTADAVAVATTEALVTFTKNVAGTSTTAQTTYSVTAGKTFRLQAIIVSMTDTSTTVARTRVRVRENTGGTCAVASSLAFTADYGPLPGTQAAGIGFAGGPYEVAIPDGLEFPAADSICISEIATTNTTAVLSITLMGYEY